MAKSLNQLCNLAVQNMTTFVNRSILCQIAPNVIENFQSLRREGPKSPFCLPSLLPLRCIGSRWNPVIIKLKDPLYPLRYHLSRLIQGIGSYLKTTTGCRTRYLKSSGLQSSQIIIIIMLSNFGIYRYRTSDWMYLAVIKMMVPKSVFTKGLVGRIRSGNSHEKYSLSPLHQVNTQSNSPLCGL